MKSFLRCSAVLTQNLLFYPLLLIMTAVYVPLATLTVTALAPFISRRRLMRRVRRAISFYGRLVFLCARPFVRVEYRDLDPKAPPAPFIFICNHRSASDPFLMACLPYEGVQIVNLWPFRLPIYGRFARIAGYLSVHELSFEQFRERIGQLLREGASVVSFPEGTRSGGREMGAFTSSIFRAALQTRARIVPLAISGNEKIPPKGSLILHPGLVKVHKLPAVEYDTYKDMPVFKLKNHVRQLLYEHLSKIESDQI